MNAMRLAGPGQPLRWESSDTPWPGPGQLRIRVAACAVCRTDLHVLDGDLKHPKPNLIPGHEVVGRIDALGNGVSGLILGQRIGFPWLGWTCGECHFCRSRRENLCTQARFHGYTLDGGYAEWMVGDARYAFPIPEAYDDASAAPLLCAGLIGHRSLCLAGDARRVGLYGFGAAAHIVAQVAVHQGRQVHAFTRPGDTEAQALARHLGAAWAGASNEAPPEPLDAALIFAPAGHLVVEALHHLERGGVVVCAGIHMSDIPSFPYELLWQERRICSVANLTRHDGEAFLQLAPRVPVRTTIQTFPLEQAQEALTRLREGRVTGAAVLIPSAVST